MARRQLLDCSAAVVAALAMTVADGGEIAAVTTTAVDVPAGTATAGVTEVCWLIVGIDALAGIIVVVRPIAAGRLPLAAQHRPAAQLLHRLAADRLQSWALPFQ
jgi:hypothetical protein